MPQHATSASHGRFEDASSADREGSALPEHLQNAHTFSPPLAGNDVSAIEEAGDPGDPSLADSPAPAAEVNEAPQEGNNDNVPSGRALVILDNAREIVAAAAPAPHRGVSKRVAAFALLAVFGLGAGVFAYSGRGEQKNISPPRMELAAAPTVAPANLAAKPSADANTAPTVLSAPETNTVKTAAFPPAEAAPEPVLAAPPIPPRSEPEQKTGAAAADAATQLSAALPEPAPTRSIAEPAAIPPAEETNAAIPPQAAPNAPATAAQPTLPPPAAAAQPGRAAALPAGPGRGQFVFVQRPNVNIRNAPSDRSPVIGIAQFGGRFVVARSDGEWVQVAQGPWRGWINQRFLGPRLPRG